MTKWTPEAIRALGPTTDLPTLAAIVECSRWKSYQMAQHGEWERLGIKVLSIGSKYRVVVQSILDVLGYGSADMDGPADEQHSARSPGERVAPFLSGHLPDHPGPDGSLQTLLGTNSNAIPLVKRARPDRPPATQQERPCITCHISLIPHRGPIWSAYQIGSFSLVQLGPSNETVRIRGNSQVVESCSRSPLAGKSSPIFAMNSRLGPEIKFIMVRQQEWLSFTRRLRPRKS